MPRAASPTPPLPGPRPRALVLGAGEHAAGIAAVLAAAGLPTTILARGREAAAATRARAAWLAGTAPGADLAAAPLGDDLAEYARGADLVLEALADDAPAVAAVLARLDHALAPALAGRGPAPAIVATTAARPVAAACAGLGEPLRRRFVGIHLFAPPTVHAGCELVAHPGTDPAVIARARALLVHLLGREVIEPADTPLFAGLRVATVALNAAARLAVTHGVVATDQLVGPLTGRALAPLATLDLLGWDVHLARLDRLRATTTAPDPAWLDAPAYLRRGVGRGPRGRAFPARGGHYRVEGAGPTARHLALDPRTETYRPLAAPAPPAWLARVHGALAAGRLAAAMDALCAAPGPAADDLRRLVLGYVAYALGLVGCVVPRARDLDRALAAGLGWIPPGALVDALGAARTLRLLEAAGLPVPAPVRAAAATGAPLVGAPPARAGAPA